MSISISSQQQGSSILEPIVDQMIEKALAPPELKIQDLLCLLFDLNRERCINEHEEARCFLTGKISQIDCRSPSETLGREEQRFYNYCLGLIDKQLDRVDQFCLEKLKSIEFVDPLVPDKEFEAYRIGVIRKQIFEKEIDEIRTQVKQLSIPLGTILPWHKSLITVSLPTNWMECNGQQVSDETSVYYPQFLPNLNGEARFLRGGSISGQMQQDAFQSHGHTFIGRYSSAPAPGAHRTDGANHGGVGGYSSSDKVQLPISIQGYGEVTSSTETRPINMSIVWIMKIK